MNRKRSKNRINRRQLREIERITAQNNALYSGMVRDCDEFHAHEQSSLTSVNISAHLNYKTNNKHHNITH